MVIFTLLLLVGTIRPGPVCSLWRLSVLRTQRLLLLLLMIQGDWIQLASSPSFLNSLSFSFLQMSHYYRLSYRLYPLSENLLSLGLSLGYDSRAASQFVVLPFSALVFPHLLPQERQISTGLHDAHYWQHLHRVCLYLMRVRLG